MSLVDDDGGPNAGSQIIRLHVKLPGDVERHVVIPGDATEKTTDANINRDHPPTDLLLASHHGSDVDGANKDDWLTTVCPRTVVISCGDHKGYRHPHCPAVLRLLNCAKLLACENHLVSAWAEDASVADEVAQLKKVKGVATVSDGVIDESTGRKRVNIFVTTSVYSTFDTKCIAYDMRAGKIKSTLLA
jgi:hypothetical protein